MCRDVGDLGPFSKVAPATTSGNSFSPFGLRQDMGFVGFRRASTAVKSTELLHPHPAQDLHGQHLAQPRRRARSSYGAQQHLAMAADRFSEGGPGSFAFRSMGHRRLGVHSSVQTGSAWAGSQSGPQSPGHRARSAAPRSRRRDGCPAAIKVRQRANQDETRCCAVPCARERAKLDRRERHSGDGPSGSGW